MGACPVDHSGSWTAPDNWDADDIALEMAEHPNIWTDGSREDFSSLGGFEVAGAGVYLPASAITLIPWYGALLKGGGDARLERCRAFLPVPGVMQTVQRAELWGAVLALQAYWPCHLGIDNLHVARTAGRLLDRDCLDKPLPMVKDGDLVALAPVHDSYLGAERRLGSLRLKEHAEDVDVQHNRVRLEDQLVNAEADTAADLGRRHPSEVLIDARRRLLKARSYWYPIMLDLHRFMIAVARVTVNHDGRGGTAPDPLVWDQGGRPKARKLAIRVNVDLASLPGPPVLLGGPWSHVNGGHISGADVAAWPYNVGILFRFTFFLNTLQWPPGSDDFGQFGVSFLELLILFEQWAGHRLLSEKVTWPHVRANPPIFNSLCSCVRGN